MSSIICNTLLLMGFSSLHMILKFKTLTSVTPASSASVHYTIFKIHIVVPQLCVPISPLFSILKLYYIPFSGFVISSKNMRFLATRFSLQFHFLESYKCKQMIKKLHSNTEIDSGNSGGQQMFLAPIGQTMLSGSRLFLFFFFLSFLWKKDV